MMEHVNKFKAAVTAAFAVLTALWGWYGWLCILWGAAMAMDVATGMFAAAKDGGWNSKVAKEGLWHKGGAIFVWLAASIMDLGIGAILAYVPDMKLPFEYTVLFGPLVVVWYLITEAGSIVENAGKLGAPIPGWLKKAISAFREKPDESVQTPQDKEKQ